MDPIDPAHVRYIKLGPGGRWMERCIAEGVIELGHGAIPHEIAGSRDWAAAEAIWTAEGRTPGKVTDFCRELRDFYTLGPDTLWITFGDGQLWWTFADREVEALAGGGEEKGYRQRRSLGGWRSSDVTGAPLLIDQLSTRLTQVAAYRQTLCNVEARDYLVRRINAIQEPAVAGALRAQEAMTDAALGLIRALHWADFELMVDLIFAASGWRRVSAVGGAAQADTDLILEQSATGERAFVQIKSKAGPKTLQDYLERFAASGMDRMFFVCHTPSGVFAPHEQTKPVHLWTGDEIARQAVGAGLLSWLIDKAR